MTSSPAFPTVSASAVGGTTRIDLNYAASMTKAGSGSIFITDGAVQTVIDRVSGQPKLRVVGGTFSKEITLDKVSISGTHVMFDVAGLPPGTKLNVYMAAGTLSSGGVPAPAITVPDKASFTAPSVDLPAGLSATIAVEDRTLKAGADIKVTVTFSKALSTLDYAAISADHARIKGVTHSVDGRTWTITLGAADSVESTTNALRLDMSKVTSSDGTRGSGVLTSNNYLVDTVVDAYLFDIIGVKDEGPSNLDGITSVSGAGGDDDQFVSGVLLGELAPDEHIELIINNLTVDKAHIHLVGKGDGWGWYYAPREDKAPPLVFKEGENEIIARVVKADGHASATVTKTIILDTNQPKVASSPDGVTNFALGADLVVTFDEAVYWKDEESDADMLYLHGDDDTVIEIYLDPSNFSEGGKKLTISAAEHRMQPGVKYSLVLPENLMDLAGNPVFGYEIQFTTDGDSGAPDARDPHATGVMVIGDGTYKAGETIKFHVKFNEYVKVIAEAIPSIGLSNGKKASYAGIAFGDELVFQYTVAAGDDASDLEISDISELGGTVEDYAHNMIDMLASAHIVHGGFFDDVGYGHLIEVKVDTIAPFTPDAPVLHAASDSGILGDDITSDDTPTLTGRGEANATIEIHEGDTLLGTGVVNTDGVWHATVDAAHALSEGRHNLTVRQADLAGNRSPVSGVLALTIDKTAPAALASVVLATDTGISSSDRITREDYAVLQGSGAEPGAGIRIMRGSEVVGVGTSDADGNWTAHVASPLPEGVHTFKVRQIDAAGHASPDSPSITFTIDRTGPESAPPAPQLAASSDSGASSSDGITRDSTPTFIGSGAMANSEVALFANEREVGRTVTDASGNWSITIADEDALSDGYYSIGLKQFDVAGNKSPYSASFNLRIDTQAAKPDRPVLAASSDSGSSNSDGITNDTTPTFSGDGAENGATVVLYAGARAIGSTTANSAGHWELTVLEADKFTVDGTYAITAKQTDKAGNVSDASNPFTLVIDTAGPAVSSFMSNTSSREFQLGFNEQIVFKPTGMFKLFRDFTDILSFSGSSASNWYVTDGAGGHDSVLNFKISLSGLYNLQMNSESVQDLAGNVAIIGSPQWGVSL